MPQTTILLILLAFVVAVGIAGYQYFYRSRGKTSRNAIFGTLRFLSVFGILLLLINPKITKTEYFVEKPKLILAIDNSASIARFNASEEVQNFAEALQQDKDLNERFDLKSFTFGRQVESGSELTFDEPQTNLPAVLKDVDNLFAQERAPTVLITDGNQTVGEEFVFAGKKFSQPLFPVAVGDTARYQDLAISRVNVNKYAFLENKFPVEVIINSSGKEPVESKVQITSGENVLFSRSVTFDQENNSEVIQAELPASAVGIRNYEVKVLPVGAEKNVVNNAKRFAVEVIDERTSVLVVYSILHPDLGALKKSIESNQQREVELKHISEAPSEIENYQLVILYQPQQNFQQVMGRLEQQKKSRWIITGPETNWRFLNAQQEIFQQEVTHQSEEFFPVLNEDFSAFQIEDPGFGSFPPLQGNFGTLKANANYEAILFRQVQGLDPQEPLLAVVDDKTSRKAFLFGVDLWKWRSQSFLENNSFEAFDTFIGKIVQYLSSERRNQRLVVEYEPLYQGAEELVITAEYFDENYTFDPRAKLTLELKDSEGKTQQIPFRLNKNRYEVDLTNLQEGNYSFTVSVSGENISRSGSFELVAFDVEKQFVRANLEDLRAVAAEKGQKVYFPDQFSHLKKDLLSDNSYIPVQKSRQNDVPLIDWYFLLAIIAASLAAEWFLRKYYGYI